MPSLSSFLPTENPVEPALDEKRGNASIAGVRVDRREDDEEIRFVGVGNPQLPAGQRKMVATLGRTGGQSERIAARAGFRQCVRADARGSQLRQKPALLFIGTPAQQGIYDQRVLDVDEDANRRIDLGQRFNRKDGVKEPRPGAAVPLGDLDAHHAELEQAVDEGPRHPRLVVHFADKRPDFAPGELEHAVAEQPFVFGQSAQGRRVFWTVCHRAGMLSFEGDEQDPPSTRLFRVGCGPCSPDGARGQSAGRCRAPARARSTAGTAACTAGAAAADSFAPTSISSASTSS